MTDKHKPGNEPGHEPGNGGAGPSQVIVHFPALGAGDPTRMERKNATSGQVIVAGVWLLVTAAWEIFSSLNAQAMQAAREQQVLQDLIRKS